MNLRLLGLIAVLITAFSGSAYALGADPVLITIDLSDPSSAIITATGAFSAVNDSRTSERAGVDLLDFLTSPAYGFSFSKGDLTPGTASTSYNVLTIDNASGRFENLNLYASRGSFQRQHFSTTSSAFTGTWTVDLSAYASELPTDGTTGYIMAGDRRDEGRMIGLWEIVSVPEPSEYGMYAFLGFALLIGFRRLSVSRQTVRA